MDNVEAELQESEFFLPGNQLSPIYISNWVMSKIRNTDN